MKKLLSILLIVSTSFLSCKISVCSAESNPDCKDYNISQTSETNKTNETIESVEKLKIQIKNLESELKEQGRKKEKNSGIFSRMCSFIGSTLKLYLVYCIFYGSAMTLSNWSEEVNPSVDIPINFISENSFPFRFLRRAIVWVNPDATLSFNLGQKDCAKTWSDWFNKFWSTSKFEVNCGAAKPLKKPLDKLVFFSCADAPCALLRGANSIYNFFKYNVFDYGNFFKG